MLRHKISYAVIASICLAVTTALTWAGGYLYYVDDVTDTLWKFDTSTHINTIVGALNISGDFGDLAWNNNTSTLYAVGGRGNNNLYRINITTGAAILIGSHNITDLFSIAWDAQTNQLYAQAANSYVYIINENNGHATYIGNNSIYPGGLAYNSSSDKLILLEAGGGYGYEIDRYTGQASMLGGGLWIDDCDLDWDPENGYYWAMDWSGNMYNYDTSFNQILISTGNPSVAAVAYAPYSVFSLNFSGDCNTNYSISITGGYAGARCAFAWGSNLGLTPVPPCPGLKIEIQNANAFRNYPDDVLYIYLNANGEYNFNKIGNPLFCGKLVQVIDLDNCVTSTLDILP